MMQILKILVGLLIILAVLPISCGAVEAWTSKHEYGAGETIKIRIALEDDETGYKVTVTDPNGHRSTFEEYDLEPDETYTIRAKAIKPTGKRSVTVRAYDEDDDQTDKDTLHFHVNRIAVLTKRDPDSSEDDWENIKNVTIDEDDIPAINGTVR